MPSETCGGSGGTRTRKVAAAVPFFWGLEENDKRVIGMG
jgi:hypothetical protein